MGTVEDRAIHAGGMPGIGFSIHKLLEAAMPHHVSLLGCELKQTGDMLTIELLFSVYSSG